MIRRDYSPPDRLRCSFAFTKDQLVPTRSQIARVRKRASLRAEAEVRAKVSWRMTRSDRGEPYGYVCFRLRHASDFSGDILFILFYFTHFLVHPFKTSRVRDRILF
ncbi:hypothetical protein E5676_scaffold173G00350 [Cucumis melo var. makuwa]|uniref:Uncharacterized protein n=1 Tax=Cucumis melo var. makuwa TaxID=1194695 RepID=A0A5A7T1L7_CUCMM|nr:hypothetical protein E6C27_scaffold228G00320 [Cucumis melo var. makuwa]TYK22404.1 hypothetical protein E5676_scaffold173G00350 [Cucumis melo var. makuwa]